ncbi:hypothetical protein MASR2M48_30160 [Spirochaetota bacterium]
MCQADVAPPLLRYHVEGGPHDAEILLRGVCPAKALGCRPVWHVIKKALSRSPYDGYDVCPLLGSRRGLVDVFVDIAGGHDQVEERAVVAAPSIALGGSSRKAPAVLDALGGCPSTSSEAFASMLLRSPKGMLITSKLGRDPVVERLYTASKL